MIQSPDIESFPAEDKFAMATSRELRMIRMTIGYDGTRYAGWQRQLNAVSVQQVLEEALEKHLGESVKTIAAGRTDSGVHAMGQVVNFRTSRNLSARAIQRGTLDYLPFDVTIHDARDVSPDFDSRKDARLRWYRYFLLNQSVRAAWGRQYVTRITGRLDLDKMRAAGALFEGNHDFRAFRAVTCNAVRTRLDMQPVELTVLPDNVIMLDFRCRSFLQNMVRIMAGTMVSAGRSDVSLEQVRSMLESGRRPVQVKTLRPDGLVLYKVLYENDLTKSEA
jgi:tRNA pseudouridine38-40 synthase